MLTSFGRVMSLTQRAAKRLPSPPEIVELDVSNSEDVDAFTERAGGRLDGVLHAIGFKPESCPAAGSSPPWEDAAVAPGLGVLAEGAGRRRAPLMGEGGSIVGLDFDNTQAWPVYDWMGVAKSAFESTARYLARDLGPKGIRVNLVCAGPIRTIAAEHPRLRAVRVGVGRAGATRLEHQGHRAGRQSVALLSDLFPATTGEMLHVDGGFTPSVRRTTHASPSSASVTFGTVAFGLTL